MNTHTPGPWSTVRLDGKRHAIVADSGHDVGNIQYATEADASLIASAPELLKALLWMEEYFRGYENVDGYSKALFKQARAAIAKATGGAA